MTGNFNQKSLFLGNFGKILAKIIQYCIEDIYENVYSDGIRNYSSKDYTRKSIYMDIFVKNFNLCIHFGDIRTKN